MRIRPDPVVENYVAIPRDFVLANKHLTLAADVFFVEGIPFLLTLSRRVKFVTAEHCPVRTAVALSNHMKTVLRVYNRAGFTVCYVLMDGEFEKSKLNSHPLYATPRKLRSTWWRQRDRSELSKRGAEALEPPSPSVPFLNE